MKPVPDLMVNPVPQPQILILACGRTASRVGRSAGRLLLAGWWRGSPVLGAAGAGRAPLSIRALVGALGSGGQWVPHPGGHRALPCRSRHPAEPLRPNVDLPRPTRHCHDHRLHPRGPLTLSGESLSGASDAGAEMVDAREVRLDRVRDPRDARQQQRHPRTLVRRLDPSSGAWMTASRADGRHRGAQQCRVPALRGSPLPGAEGR